MQQISSSVEALVIQGGVGRKSETFNLSCLPSLITLEMGFGAFRNCASAVFESKNDKVNDELDLPILKSITLGSFALDGYFNNSNTLEMKST